MRAVGFKGVRDLEIVELPVPDIRADRVLVEIKASALCTWEQRVYSGVKEVKFPFVGGHEMSGKILKIGGDVDKRHWREGDNVVIGATLPCGSCYQCKSGEEQNCAYFSHTRVIDGLPYTGMGGLCSHFIARTANLFKYSGVTHEEAALAEPLSCVIHSIETGNLQFGEAVMVIGCGIMGLLHVILAAKKGACVIACDLDEDRLNLASKLGAAFTINPQKDKISQKILKYTDGVKLQAIFDTTPISEVAEDALKYLSNKGRLILYSSFYPDVPVQLSPDWLHKSGASIIGSANSNPRDFMKAVRLLSYGIVDVKELISEVYEVNDIIKAFESAANGDKFRIIVRF